MLSLTGSGTGRAGDARGEVRVSLTAVNHRSWQLQLRSDLNDPALDDALRTALRTALVRGSVTAHVQAIPATVGGLDRESLIGTWRELAALAQELGAPTPALEQVARLAVPRGQASTWDDLAQSAVSQAIANLSRAREVEGAALHAALAGSATTLRSLLGRMGERAAARLPLYRESLAKRVSEAVGNAVDAATLAREIALHAERIDITEELVRLSAHLDALDVLLADQGEIGRRLDFLAQEIGREVNTTGAKANDATLTALVLDAKVAVDQIKEQAANVI